MDVALVYRGRVAGTGRQIADALGIQRHGKRPDERPITTLVRWGDSRPVRGVTREVNTAAAIATAANKLETFSALESAGVPIPAYTRDIWTAEEWRRQGATVFGRSPYGQGGTDISILGTREEVSGFFNPVRSFYVKWVPIAREYRVHVVRDAVVRVQGKHLDHPEQSDGGLVHNYAHGWRFRAPRQTLRPDRLDMSIRAVKACGLDFGAVDLIVSEDGTAVVLEVNTAPGCSPLTLSAYVDALRPIVFPTSATYIPFDYAALEGGETLVP